MSFTIQKSLGNTFFRFAASRRRELRSIDDDPELSTGPSGEFIRHRPEIFYSADMRQIHKPEMPPPRSVMSEPFWGSLIDGTTRGWVFVGMMIFGALLLLFGLVVLAKNGAPGIVPILLGLILLVTPVVITGQKRRAIRQREDQARREREERDKRNRELLDAYTGALEKLRDDPSDTNLALVQRENEKLDLPYAIWADTAIGTVLYVGFSTLARVGADRAGEVATLMDRSSDAAGLIAEDALAVKRALYSTILWHLLADDRLGEVQTKIVRAIQNGFGITAEHVPVDDAAEAQFERLRGIDHRNAPKCGAPFPLGLNEWCMYTAQVRLADGTTPDVVITNKRFIVDREKRVEVTVRSIDDIFVDADTSAITVRSSDLKKPVQLSAGEAIYLAAVLDLSMRLDDRPKSFM